jgi:hypothetical protein
VAGNSAGAFDATPKGVILHGTRSGRGYETDAELRATVRYVEAGAGGLGWHATVGEDAVCEHLRPGLYGWNAREHSSQYLALELAQADVSRPIGDGQVRAAAWWIAQARAVWPALPLVFPSHAELAAGVRDGKTDPYPRYDPRMEDLRSRVLRRLTEAHGLT